MEKERCDLLKHVRDHRHKLEHRIKDHMEADGSASRTTSLKEMIASWMDMKHLEQELTHCSLSHEDMVKWVEGMKNSDGTTGAHWNMEQTTAVAKMTGVLMSHITPEEFWLAMNMMYSDYGHVADKFNVNKPEFFAELAKAFLFDKDAPDPDDKLAAYYRGVVEYDD